MSGWCQWAQFQYQNQYCCVFRMKIILFAFIAAVLAVHSAFAENSASAAKNTGASITITEEALHEFETRKKQLDARERELEEKSKALDLQEKILKEKLKKMEDLNRKMAERLEKYKKDHEDKLAKMVGMVIDAPVFFAAEAEFSANAECTAKTAAINANKIIFIRKTQQY
jgi:septal ring factor EnvC (AmiA/AmiB activator)